jgi:hypothetical protein
MSRGIRIRLGQRVDLDRKLDVDRRLILGPWRPA